MVVALRVCLSQDAEENLGETEVRDALFAKANFLGNIGDRDAAAKAYKETEDKTASGGSKADMVFSQIRCVWWQKTRVFGCLYVMLLWNSQYQVCSRVNFNTV